MDIKIQSVIPNHIYSQKEGKISKDEIISRFAQTRVNSYRSPYSILGFKHH